MDYIKKEVSERRVETSQGLPAPAPEIVRTFVSEFEVSSRSQSLCIGRVFRCHGIDNSTLGTSAWRASAQTQDEENPGDVGFVSEGAD